MVIEDNDPIRPELIPIDLAIQATQDNQEGNTNPFILICVTFLLQT